MRYFDLFGETNWIFKQADKIWVLMLRDCAEWTIAFWILSAPQMPDANTRPLNTDTLHAAAMSCSILRYPVSDGSERIVISEKSAPRTFELVNEELSDALIEQFAGIDAVKFCQHQHTFLVKEPNDVNEILNRRRRQAATDPLDIPIDSRSPNCMDLLLDCGRRVVEVNNCYTWINGAMLMHRECLADNEFRVTLTKPKGRISQIQEEQWEICKERRKQGLRC
uniref:Uncharacterized protein n=1 Tax=Ascaris lumbricoides TaxID=6252 RepID=A0A9J2PBB0_ASCLU